MKGKKVSNYELFFDIVCSDPKKLDFLGSLQFYKSFCVYFSNNVIGNNENSRSTASFLNAK